MKPIAIFRHARTEGPGFFAEFLDRRAIAWRVIQIDRGEPVPTNVHEFAGLCFMGGPMSVNDDLPWIAPTLALIQAAVAANLPVIGHCLGGQLLAKALGGSVGPSPVKEIGWGEVSVSNADIARAWLGDLRSFEAFHWHGEMFSIPAGATCIAANANCPHQMFVFGERHVGMQCHVEMTSELIESWCTSGAREIESSNSPAVMPVALIQRDLPQRVGELNKIAERVYTRWVEGLA